MRLPTLSSGATLTAMVSGPRARGRAAVYPQAIFCGPCEPDDSDPGTCSQDCVVYKNGEIINDFTRSCRCPKPAPCCTCTQTGCVQYGPPGCRMC